MRLIHTIRTVLLFAVATLAVAKLQAASPGTAFTYQGRLNSGGNAATGLYDFDFVLYNAASGGSPQGLAFTLNAVPVTNGLFTVALDFGNVFDGNPRWLDISVKTNGAGSFTPLAPRQPVTPTPYALQAARVVGSGVTTASLQDGSVTGVKIGDGHVVRSINGIRDAVDIVSGDGLGITTDPANHQVVLSAPALYNAWLTSGNGGYVPEPVLGATNSFSLDFRIWQGRALRLENYSLTPGTAPNVIGGHGNNQVPTYVHGAFIGGGGSVNGFNQVTGDYGAVVGGENNSAWIHSFVGGGADNLAQGFRSAIAAGDHNQISAGGLGFIGAGRSNVVSADLAAVVAGQGNQAGGNNSFIGGGYLNTNNGTYASITGGGLNQAAGSSTFIGGGQGNRVDGVFATVTGGTENYANGYGAAVLGGAGNIATGTRALAAGGGPNLASGNSAVALGGNGNQALGDNSFAAGQAARALHPLAFVWNGLPGIATSSVPEEIILNGSRFTYTANPTIPFESGYNFRVGGSAQVAGYVKAQGFIGDGSQLSGITSENAQNAYWAQFAGSATIASDAQNAQNAAQLGGKTAQEFAVLATNNTFTGSNILRGVVTATNTGNTFVGAFTGNGAGLTNLNAATLNGHTAASFASNVYTLVVELEGNGTGNATANPGNINCGQGCAWNYAPGTVVALAAAPNADSVFLGWSGACTGAVCSITMDGPKHVKAVFQKKTYLLTVTRTGGGVVSSSIGGLYCGAVCGANIDAGSIVILTALADPGCSFAGWSGAANGTSPTCSVTMDAAKNITATFTTPLTVSKTGTGAGTITSSPGSINCGSSCIASFNAGTVVTLTATPDSTSVFAGWSGAVSGSSPTAVLTVDQAKSVTATFTRQPYALSVARNGGGTINSQPDGIYCGANCSASFEAGTMVTLTANPEPGYTFVGWSGAASGSSLTCVVAMGSANTVNAEFSGGPVFAGSGAGLTNLSAANLTGTLADARLSANIARLDASQNFTGLNTFAGVSVLNNSNNVFRGSFNGWFAGDGAGLTNLNRAYEAEFAMHAHDLLGVFSGDVTGAQNATSLERIHGNPLSYDTPTANQLLRFDGAQWAPSQVVLSTDVSGTLADSRLSANVALLAGTNQFNGTNSFAGVSVLTNANNVIYGSFTGNGAGLTQLNASQLASGIVSLAQLPAVVLTNGASAVNLAGTFVGSGAGLTNLSAPNLTGTLADARLSGNVALLNGAPSFSGAVTAPAFAGNGAGLTNLNATNLSGTIGASQIAPTVAGNGLTGGGGSALHVGAGSGLAVTADAIGVGSLTENWMQHGPWDVVLNNPSSELAIMESVGGTFYGTLDVGDLSANQTYTFSGPGGGVWTAGNDGSGSGLDADLLDGQSANAFAAATHAHSAGDIANGTLADSRLSANVALLAGTNQFTGTNTFTGVSVLTNHNNVIHGSFTGNGAGLTQLDAANVSSGTLSDARLGGNVALLNGAPSFSGAVTAPSFAGNGAGLTQLNASQLSSGIVSLAQLPTVVLTNGASAVNLAGTFAGSGASLSNLDAANLSSGTVADVLLAANVARTNQVWLLDGNVGTAPGANFIGTRDNQALELKANNVRALRIEPTVNDANHSNSVNLVGGAPLNYAAPGVSGSVIGGGGAANYYGAAYSNGVSADLAFLGGGGNNFIQPNANNSFLGGGFSNSISGRYGVVPGGDRNVAGTNSFAAGHRAKANHTGTFVWADSTDADFASTVSNQFSIRASGGVRFDTSGGGATVDGALIFTGNNGSGLTSLNASQVTLGTLPDARLSANAALLNSVQTFTGAKTFINNSNSFNGNGSGLIALNASELSSGSVADSRLSTNVSLLDNNQTLTGAKTFSNVANSFTGNGAGLTSLNASQLSSGSVPDGRLSANVPLLSGGKLLDSVLSANVGLLNNVQTFTGAKTFSSAANSFTGSGSGLIGLNASQLTSGAVSDSRLSANVALLNGSQTFTGAKTFTGTTTLSNTVQVNATVFMNDRDIQLRGDGLHGLGWYGDLKVFGGVNVNGPVLYGNGGGGLGSINGTATNLALFWNSAGNVGIGAASPGQKLYVAGNIYATGTITPNSDRNLKTDLAPVDTAAVLEEVAKLPIQQWRFKAEAEGVKHVGPMAQDFRAAFGLGEIPTAIATVDADGVALAAIQGLNRKLEEKGAEIQALKRQNESLAERLHSLEQMVKSAATRN